MEAAAQQQWVMRSILIGAAYLTISLVLSGMEKLSAPASAKTWRLATWGVCLLIYFAQIGYERYQLANPIRAAALHVAAGVGIGSFGLAAAAIVHSLASASGNPKLLSVALLAWPAITAIPAYFVALVASAILARTSGNACPVSDK